MPPPVSVSASSRCVACTHTRGARLAPPSHRAGERGKKVPESDIERVLQHRVRAHIAALRTAAALGSPVILAAQVRETEARLAEVRAILDELEREGPRG